MAPNVLEAVSVTAIPARRSTYLATGPTPTRRRWERSGRQTPSSLSSRLETAELTAVRKLRRSGSAALGPKLRGWYASRPLRNCVPSTSRRVSKQQRGYTLERILTGALSAIAVGNNRRVSRQRGANRRPGEIRWGALLSVGQVAGSRGQ